MAGPEPENPFDPVTADHDVTALLLAWRAGDATAIDRLFPLVYDELRRIAHRQLSREQVGHTLETTALVHEAYLKLVDQTRAQWSERSQFFAIAARAMRRILVDYARQHVAGKRGGRRERVNLDAETLSLDDRADVLVAVDEALERLREVDERASRVVECRFFGGYTEEETAQALAITDRTVRRDWVRAKAWLYDALREGT
ncbi:MAG TPA: sigma-70 family RNA polymerase sigma factor [Gemmatimonadales bacterium]|jgi:RNA polymerase sigma factor (TIGR02999 family)|nr:sigma-70 family RNA polymerase sigma factor [Gemmatimonadales bacterium]